MNQCIILLCLFGVYSIAEAKCGKESSTNRVLFQNTDHESCWWKADLAKTFDDDFLNVTIDLRGPAGDRTLLIYGHDIDLKKHSCIIATLPGSRCVRKDRISLCEAVEKTEGVSAVIFTSTVAGEWLEIKYSREKCHMKIESSPTSATVATTETSETNWHMKTMNVTSPVNRFSTMMEDSILKQARGKKPRNLLVTLLVPRENHMASTDSSMPVDIVHDTGPLNTSVYIVAAALFVLLLTVIALMVINVRRRQKYSTSEQERNTPVTYVNSSQRSYSDHIYQECYFDTQPIPHSRKSNEAYVLQPESKVSANKDTISYDSRGYVNLAKANGVAPNEQKNTTNGELNSLPGTSDYTHMKPGTSFNTPTNASSRTNLDSSGKLAYPRPPRPGKQLEFGNIKSVHLSTQIYQNQVSKDDQSKVGKLHNIGQVWESAYDDTSRLGKEHWIPVNLETQSELPYAEITSEQTIPDNDSSNNSHYVAMGSILPTEQKLRSTTYVSMAALNLNDA